VAGDISEREIRATPQTLPLNPQTAAVLPFHNQSADPEQEYFCDGITDVSAGLRQTHFSRF
jgi:TolB-like protein